MSETKWTPAQCAAIDDRGGALLVSAAAGSGKTAVLTERAVRLITDPEHPVDADRLLIVTFTNAAAAELRARIGQALLRRSQAEPGNTALRRQRMLLQRAPICTIDAFCLDLLHKHFQALDIPPDFTPADPGSVEMLRNAALSETLEAAYQDADFCAFADLYGKGRTDKAAGEAVLQVYDFLRALPDYGKKLDKMLAPWQDENGFARTCWHNILMQEAARSARAAKELLCAALNDCREDFVTAQADAEASKKTPAAKEKAVAAVNEKFAEPLEKLENSAALLGEVERLAGAGEWSPLYDRLTPYVLGMEQAPGLKNMKKRLTGEHKDAVKTRADEAAKLFEKIEDLISCSLDEAELDRKAAEPCLRALFAAVRDFDARFAARKRERRLLEFSDFEHLALRLLRDADGQPTELCQGIRQGYAAVMVDEYQDTNALQDALYRCLASPAGDDLFLVGDLKQSIYRFRQADPSIFREKLESWPLLPGGEARPRPEDGRPGENAMLALDANFRSAPQVVAGINFIFEQLMTPALGDTAYGDGQRLVCGAPGAYEGSVEAHFLPDDAAETDAKYIADRIEAMLTSISTDNIMATMDVLNRKALILEAIILLIILAVAMVLSDVLTRPFSHITQAINEVKAGYTDEKISVPDYSETIHIVDAFNQLLGRMKVLDDSRQEFVSNVSHELKTPLTSMKVLADSLLAQPDAPAEMYREFLQDITAEIDRENQIITDLLSLVKMDKKAVDLNVSAVNINELTELICKRLRPIARKKDVEVELTSLRPVVAEVDEVKMTLIISNLVENAIKYNKEHGSVKITLDADHQVFTLEVKDTGIGIPQDSLDNIYERFYRVDKSHSREIGGTGLGLAITKNAVLMHRGSITVSSLEGEGTTFLVKIPLTHINS